MNTKLDSGQVAVQGTNCQVCAYSPIEELLDLGYQPLCNMFLPKEDAPQPQTFYPLCLSHCPRCSLIQLNYIIPTAEAFGEQYTYLTGSSPALLEYYLKLAARFVEKFQMKPGDAVVEVGSNDGTFLKAFQDLGMRVIGVDGAKVSADLAEKNGIPTINEFFGKGTASDVRNRLPAGARIRLVLAMNVLAHTDNINELLTEVSELMDSDTMFISQSHWLVSLVSKFEFDTIYHEHLRYYTLGSLGSLLGRHGLTVVDAETNDFYGGSILVYAGKHPEAPSAQLASILRQEQATDVIGSLRAMKSELLNNKARLIDLLVKLRASGKRVVGIGAPMKASTLLNFYGITADLVEYLAEVNELKVGTLVPGVRIPVLNEDQFFQEQPDYAILLSWNMAETIVPKLRSLGYSGKFILPVPEVQVIE